MWSSSLCFWSKFLSSHLMSLSQGPPLMLWKEIQPTGGGFDPGSSGTLSERSTFTPTRLLLSIITYSILLDPPPLLPFGLDYFDPTNNLPNSFIFMRFRVYFPHFLPKLSAPPLHTHKHTLCRFETFCPPPLVNRQFSTEEYFENDDYDNYNSVITID